MEQNQENQEKGEENSSANNDNTDMNALQLIVEQVPQAREVYQLYAQLRKALPIKSFEDLRRAGDQEGMLYFRDEKASLTFFEGLIPEFIFPIVDENSWQ